MQSECMGRGYFAGLRMTNRRNNVRNVMFFFAIFTDKERKELKVFVYTRNYKKSLRKK